MYVLLQGPLSLESKSKYHILEIVDPPPRPFLCPFPSKGTVYDYRFIKEVTCTTYPLYNLICCVHHFMLFVFYPYLVWVVSIGLMYDLHLQGMGKWELWTEEIKDAPPIPKVLHFKLSSQLFMYFFPFSFYISKIDQFLELRDLPLEFVITTKLKRSYDFITMLI